MLNYPPPISFRPEVCAQIPRPNDERSINMDMYKHACVYIAHRQSSNEQWHTLVVERRQRKTYVIVSLYVCFVWSGDSGDTQLFSDVCVVRLCSKAREDPHKQMN